LEDPVADHAIDLAPSLRLDLKVEDCGEADGPQHPQPVFWGGGSFPPDWSRVFMWQMLAMMLLAIVIVGVRLRQEESQREIDSLRRMAHSF
jgi:hypothetical protein